MKKIIAVNLALMILLVGLFDVLSYNFLPAHWLMAFDGYRTDPTLPVSERFPRDYYVADSVKGFDIGFDLVSRHDLDEISYPVWSNSLGCFDREHGELDEYVYFAGDSFLWGYAPFESKFATLVEKWTGTPIFKCGVEHTGQRHQFAKMADVVARAGQAPKAVFVFHFHNDPANDYAHPHTTVIDGWPVDAVLIGADGTVHRRSTEALSRRVAEEKDELRRRHEQRKRDRSDPWLRFRSGVKYYSLSANIAWSAKAALPSPPSPGHQVRTDIYGIPRDRDGRYWYADNPFAAANREALLAFKSWTFERRIPLVVVIVPGRFFNEGPGWYKELNDFLDQEGIRYLDLAHVFDERGLDLRRLFWLRNGHFNTEGNEVVARILAEEFGDIFGAPGDTFQAHFRGLPQRVATPR